MNIMNHPTPEAREAALGEIRAAFEYNNEPWKQPEPTGHFVQLAINNAIGECNVKWLRSISDVGLSFDDSGTLVNSAVAEKNAEIERLKHIIECAKTPLMADVMRERDTYLARIQMVEEYRINASLKSQLAKLEEIADGLAAGFTIYPNLIWTEKCADALEALKQYKEAK